MKTLRAGAGLPTCVAVFVAIALPLVAQETQPAAGDSQSREQEERELIAVLQSDAALFDKDVACRRLAIIGTREAVPALAALLTDEKLSDIARHGLEPIPDRSVDDALRGALTKVGGRLLIGVVTSIGNRGDREAVPELVGLLGGADQGVAAAAATALGKIGGDRSAGALERALADAPAALRPAMADACLWCAQALLNEGKRKRALALLDRVRRADLPPYVVAAATRGVILGRGAGSIRLLVELLRSDDEELLGAGLRVVREIPGEQVTGALTAELENLPPDRRDLVMEAVRDRDDAAALLRPAD
jgi:HEAT repeat protein